MPGDGKASPGIGTALPGAKNGACCTGVAESEANRKASRGAAAGSNTFKPGWTGCSGSAGSVLRMAIETGQARPGTAPACALVTIVELAAGAVDFSSSAPNEAILAFATPLPGAAGRSGKPAVTTDADARVTD